MFAPVRRAIAEARQVVQYIWYHPANHGRRMAALASAARFQIRGRVFGRRTLTGLGARSLIWAELHRTAGSRVVYANPPDYPEMLIWARTLEPGGLFVDIGANIGIYTIWAGELGTRVLAVEPAADTFALLRENVLLNGYPVELIQAAAGADRGTAKFTSGRDCVNQLDPTGDVEVELMTVDDLLRGRAVSGMKIDVEGYEIDVLRGSVEALSSGRIRLIQIEWNRSSEVAVGSDRRPIADLLARFDYRLHRPDSEGRLVAAGRYPPYGSDVFAMRADPGTD